MLKTWGSLGCVVCWVVIAFGMLRLCNSVEALVTVESKQNEHLQALINIKEEE